MLEPTGKHRRNLFLLVPLAVFITTSSAAANTDTIRVCAFNIFRFGPTKAGRPAVMEAIAEDPRYRVDERHKYGQGAKVVELVLEIYDRRQGCTHAEVTSIG